MKKTTIITAAIIGLAFTVFAGEALGQPGGRGRGGGPGWGRGPGGGPQMGPNIQSAQPDNSWVPGPYCPWGQVPNQNIQGRQYPWPGQGRFNQGFLGPRGPYCPFGQGPYGQGFGRWNMTMQRRPMAGRGGRSPAMQGGGGRGFQRRNFAPQGWRMNNRQGQPGPGNIGRPGRGIQPRRFAPQNWDQTNQPMPPGGRGWIPGLGQGRGWRQGMGPGWWQNQQPETAPDTNAPKPPIVEEQPEIPQGQ